MTIFTYRFCGRLALTSGLALAGCEAPLNLEGVDREMQKVSHRFDQFQAVAQSNNRVVVVGAAGAILSRDHGDSEWTRTDLAPTPSLIDVAACGDGSFVALAIDRQVWVANSDLTQWQAIAIPTMEEVLAIDCRADGSYWVTGSFSTILSSSDGGQNWHENSLGEDAQLTTIQFLDNNTGYAGGEFGVFLKTEDSGTSWNNVEYLPGEFYPQDSFFRDANEGWAVGLNGAIFYTSDGGNSWQSQDSGTRIPLYGIDGDANHLFAVGESGIVLQHRNGQWQPKHYDGGVLAYLRGVTISGQQLIIAGGNGASMTLPLN